MFVLEKNITGENREGTPTNQDVVFDFGFPLKPLKNRYPPPPKKKRYPEKDGLGCSIWLS